MDERTELDRISCQSAGTYHQAGGVVVDIIFSTVSEAQVVADFMHLRGRIVAPVIIINTAVIVDVGLKTGGFHLSCTRKGLAPDSILKLNADKRNLRSRTTVHLHTQSNHQTTLVANIS